MFFCRDAKGQLCQLPINALDEDILTADGSTLKLYNQKNWWIVVCVYQEYNIDTKFIPARAVGRWCVSIRHQISNKKNICHNIGLIASAKTLLLITWAHRWNLQPPNWFIRIWNVFHLREWTLILWDLEKIIHCRHWDIETEIYKKWVGG